MRRVPLRGRRQVQETVKARVSLTKARRSAPRRVYQTRCVSMPSGSTMRQDDPNPSTRSRPITMGVTKSYSDGESPISAPRRPCTRSPSADRCGAAPRSVARSSETEMRWNLVRAAVCALPFDVERIAVEDPRRPGVRGIEPFRIEFRGVANETAGLRAVAAYRFVEAAPDLARGRSENVRNRVSEVASPNQGSVIAPHFGVVRSGPIPSSCQQGVAVGHWLDEEILRSVPARWRLRRRCPRRGW